MQLLIVLVAPGSWARRLGRAYLTGPVNQVFVTGQLFGSHWSARVNPPGGDSNFSTHAEFAAIGELRRRVVQQNRAVQVMEELLHGLLILSNDRFGVPGSIASDVLDSLIDAGNGPD